MPDSLFSLRLTTFDIEKTYVERINILQKLSACDDHWFYSSAVFLIVPPFGALFVCLFVHLSFKGLC